MTKKYNAWDTIVAVADYHKKQAKQLTLFKTLVSSNKITFFKWHDPSPIDGYPSFLAMKIVTKKDKKKYVAYTYNTTFKQWVFWYEGEINHISDTSLFETIPTEELAIKYQLKCDEENNKMYNDPNWANEYWNHAYWLDSYEDGKI